MSDELTLILNDDQVDNNAEALDDAFDFREIIKNPFWGATAEAVDGLGFRIAVRQANVIASKYVPGDMKDELRVIVVDCTDGDKTYTDAINELRSLNAEIGKVLLEKGKNPAILSWITIFVEGIISILHIMDGKGTF